MRFTVGQVGQIARGLMDGYGAEDIAIDMGVNVKHIQFQIRRFRTVGNIVTIAEEARQRQRIELRRRGVSL